MATPTFPTAIASEHNALRAISESTLIDFSHLKSEDCRIYKKRWLMLTIYSLCAVADAMHWLQYAIITETTKKYYGVSLFVIDFTALSYGIMFIIFVFPAIRLIERFGLKKMLICGDAMIIAASGLKLASLNPEYFYVGFAGQFLAGIAQVFIVNVPSYLAGLWFPRSEVSTACALGVLGTQIGVALSFYVPPQMISIGEKFHGPEGTRKGLFYVYIYQLILPVFLLPLLVFVFKAYPAKPPSYARLAKNDDNEMGWTAVKQLFINLNYNLVLVSYSMNVAVFYCISTLLNQIITRAEFAGTVGATIVIFGIAGRFFFGWLLDKTHEFKFISLITYGLAMVGLAMFWANVMWDIHDSVYLVSAFIIGFFLSSYVIISIEFASELTYPLCETMSTSILLASGEAVSIVLIYGSQALMDEYGKVSVICTTFAFMLIGLVPTFLIKNVHLKRFEAFTTEDEWREPQNPNPRTIAFSRSRSKSPLKGKNDGEQRKGQEVKKPKEYPEKRSKSPLK